MSLRNQPYIPLYIQDFLTDEKLAECSASACGVYIRIMCLMHKSDEYGTILLKQKDKQTDNQIKNFACKIAKFLPYSIEVIFESLTELISEKVLYLDEDKLIQKRMVYDNGISIVRSKSGKAGGEKSSFAKAKSKPKELANSENENENESKTFDMAYYKSLGYDWGLSSAVYTELDKFLAYRISSHKDAIRTPDTLEAIIRRLRETAKTESDALFIIRNTIEKQAKNLIFELQKPASNFQTKEVTKKYKPL